MPNYDWREFSTRAAFERFPQWALGYDLWQGLGDSGPESLGGVLNALVTYRLSANWEQRSTTWRGPRLFISHRRTDEARAIEIAELARRNGFDYWLDVLDQNLTRIGRRGPSTLSPEEQSQEIAGFIETALLNCTHVIAVMTPDTWGSMWVPYEYGRVKDSSPYSLQAACWLDARVAGRVLPEYLSLGVKTGSDADIEQWLQTQFAEWQRRWDPVPSTPPLTKEATALAESRAEGEKLAKFLVDGYPQVIHVTRPLTLRTGGG